MIGWLITKLDRCWDFIAHGAGAAMGIGLVLSLTGDLHRIRDVADAFVQQVKQDLDNE